MNTVLLRIVSKFIDSYVTFLTPREKYIANLLVQEGYLTYDQNTGQYKRIEFPVQ